MTHERCLTPPKGMLGGRDGVPFSITIRRADQTIQMRSVWNGTLVKGDVIVVEIAGGGYGAIIALKYVSAR